MACHANWQFGSQHHNTNLQHFLEHTLKLLFFSEAPGAFIYKGMANFEQPK